MKKVGKKLLVLSSVVCLSLGLAACASGNNGVDTGGNGGNDKEEVTVNKLALERKIDYVKNNYLEKQASYTEETYNALKAAYDAALLVNQNKAATQKEVDDALAKLTTAEEALVSIVKPAKSIDEIAEWMEETNGNYTLNVKDYFSKEEYKQTPLEYKLLATGDSIYDVNLNKGLTVYSDFIYEFNYVDNNINMGRRYLGDNLFPSKFLAGTDFANRAVNIIGISEQFTTNGLPIYGFFEKVPNTTVYKTDNSNFYAFFLDLTFDRYNYGSSIDTMFSAATLEFENNVLVGSLLDSEGKVAFEFSLSDVKNTSIKGLEEYKTAHPTYDFNQKYVPNEKAQEIVAADSKKASGIEIDVFSNKRGNANQMPNYTLTSRVNENGVSYWLSSLGYGIIDEGGLSKSFTLKDNALEVGKESNIQVKTLDIVKLLISKYEGATKGLGDDEYYVSLTPEEIKVLYNFFDLANLSSWASKDYFGDSVSPIEATDIKKVSLSLNDDKNLMISVWSEKGLICRGVVKAYENVKNELLENAALRSRKNLESIVKDADAKNQADYEAVSFTAFSTIKALCKELLNNPEASSSEMDEARILLEERMNELEPKEFAAKENGYKDVTSFIDGKIYVDEYGIGEYEFKGYAMEVTMSGKTDTYVINSDYAYCQTKQNGYIRFEGVVYNFELKDGKLVLGDPVIHNSGFSQNYITRVINKIGQVADMAKEGASFNPKNDMVRIPNTNQWFIANPSYAEFIPGVDLTNKIGVGLTVNNGKLELYLYEGPKYITFDQNANISTLISYRKEASVKVVISNPGAAKDAKLDELLKDTATVTTKEDVKTIASLLPETVEVITKGNPESFTLYNDKYFYSAETNLAYVLVNGKVKEIKLDLNPESPTFPYTITKEEVIVNGKAAVSISEVAAEINVLKTLKDTDLTDFMVRGKVSRNKYLVSDLVKEKLVKEFGYNAVTEVEDSMVISLNSSFDITLGLYSSNRYEAYKVITGRLDEQADLVDTMLPNIIMALEGNI